MRSAPCAYGASLREDTAEQKTWQVRLMAARPVLGVDYPDMVAIQRGDAHSFVYRFGGNITGCYPVNDDRVSLRGTRRNCRLSNIEGRNIRFSIHSSCEYSSRIQ